MKLTFELTDHNVSALRRELKISKEDWEHLKKCDGQANPYARKIIEVRLALDMGVQWEDCTE